MKKLLKTILFLLSLLLIFVIFNFFYTYKLKTGENNYKQEKYKNLDEVPDRIKNWTLKIEDKRFYHHFGIDFLALGRAIKEDLKYGKFKQGASTIDQQVIKLSEGNFGKRGILTKFKEIFLAINLNFHYKKDDILLYWINNVQFPYGVKGFKSACKIYFQRDCDKLFDSELLFLFAMYQTGKNPVGYKKISRRYQEDKKISKGFQDDSSDNFKKIKDRSYVLYKYLKFLSPGTIYKLPPVSSKDITPIFKKLTIFDLLPKNIKSKLKINPKYQKLSESIIENTAGYRKNINMQDCCILILDKKGNILTMNTCRKLGNNKENSWINGCLIKRQTGSAIKPFVYLKAMIDFNRTGGTILEDKPVDFVLNGLKKYIPRNFDLKYHGKVPLSLALGSSLNVPAVTTLEKIGVQNFLDFVNNLRLALGEYKKQIEADQQTYTADKLGLSVALGTYEMSVWEFANLWRVFLIEKSEEIRKKSEENNFNGKFRTESLELRNNKKEDPASSAGGQQLDNLETSSEGQLGNRSKSLLSSDNLLVKSSEISSILSQNKNRLISFELENNLDAPGWAVKTGTSRHFVDGWTCGVNRDKKLVLCVWAGNYNQAGMTKPGSESAGFLWNLMVSKIK